MDAALRSIFRTLQYACRPAFRREYGAAMQRDFADGVRDELCVHGALAALTFALSAYADLLLTAFREYFAMIFRDLVFAFRSLRKTPLFAAIVVATLALAIAANATVFSILHAVILSPLPYPEPNRLVAMLGTKDGGPFSLSLPDFHDVSVRTRSFTSLAAFSPRSATMTGKGFPERLFGISATPTLFETLGVRPLLGRAFRADDARAGSAPAVVISETLWRASFGADPLALGANLELDGKRYRVVGVVPATLRQPDFDSRELADESFWLPLDPNSRAAEYGRGAHYFQAIARLRPGVDIASARAEVAAIYARIERANPADDKHYGVALSSAYETIVGNVRPLLLSIFAAVAGVLFVACANVAN
ncbi:MAG: ABC transporter permease, partial [Candidatus Eremiobacteraeota bacterium]|nr:ABC transporter permease [Candidatus Eremiobacteraeota bacterium]